MRPDITSRQHRIVGRFKDAARGDGDLALLDGWHLLHDAEAAALEIDTVAVSALPTQQRDRRLLERLARTSTVVQVTTAVMDALSPSRSPAGIAALARPRTVVFDELLAPAPALVMVAIDIQDPGNAGAIVRSAEAGGATGVVLVGHSADPWGWKALRAAMGSTFRLPALRGGDAGAVLDELRDAGLAIIATTPRAGAAPDEARLDGPLALVVGGEGAGLAADVLDRADQRVSIPMEGGVESLNVAVATALLVYEARRQRRLRRTP